MSERPAGRRTRALEFLVLAVVVAFAFWIRVHDITSFRIGPDDGNYLNSARIQAVERFGSPIEWVRADVAWVKELVRLYDEPNQTYQHSYLHQLTARWLYRFGFGALESLRWSSALHGTLAVLVVAWLVRRLMPTRRWLAVLAAAFVALSPLLAFLSRTGWGQTGFACWYLAFLVFAHRALIERPEPDARTLRRAALGMIATSLLAFGWHEGVAPYVAGTALVALAAPWIRGETWSARAALSRRWWTYFAGASVVGMLTLALLFSPFARAVWFNTLGRAPEGTSWLQLKGLTLQNLFVQQRPDLLITWPILALALAGGVWLRRVDRTAFRWLVANMLAAPLLLFLFFGDAWLLRAHLPSVVLLMVFAACGIAWVADRLGHAAAVAVGCTVLALTATTTWSSLFGRHLGPLFIQKLYDQTNQLDHRHVDEEMYDLLQREIQPGDAVGVWGDKACIFRLLDRGIVAREDYMEEPRPLATWPRWVVGVPSGPDGFERSRFFDAQGGPYHLRAKDNVGRHALYER